MTVYVDSARNRLGRMRMSHLVADTLEELHAAAAKLGLRREWFQRDASFPHYDICQAKRRVAVERHGVVEVDRRQLVEVMRRYRAKAAG